jgi:hypothetical protein
MPARSREEKAPGRRSNRRSKFVSSQSHLGGRTDVGSECKLRSNMHAHRFDAATVRPTVAVGGIVSTFGDHWPSMMTSLTLA